MLTFPRRFSGNSAFSGLTEAAQRGQAAEWHPRLAQRRAADHPDELAALYVDGHVRACNGQHRLDKSYAMRLKIVVHGETDYGVHLRSGRPLLVVPCACWETTPR